MKNPNGYGSVYKLSGNRRRPWIARVTTGWSDEGKQQYYTIGYFETRREGMEALAEYHKNPIAERGDVTLAEIYTEWSGSRFPKLAHKTVRSYETAWDNHLNKLGHHKIKDIKTSHLQNIINDMAEKGLSRSSCHKVKVLANQLFKYAMADDIVNKNYTEFVKLPKETKSKQQEVFTDMEIRTLFKNEHVKWVDTILIFIYTGMRISEFLSITKFNVDMQNMIITGGIKTDAGRDRVIPIHPKIQKYISKWYNTD